MHHLYNKGIQYRPKRERKRKCILHLEAIKRWWHAHVDEGEMCELRNDFTLAILSPSQQSFIRLGLLCLYERNCAILYLLECIDLLSLVVPGEIECFLFEFPFSSHSPSSQIEFEIFQQRRFIQAAELNDWILSKELL